MAHIKESPWWAQALLVALLALVGGAIGDRVVFDHSIKIQNEQSIINRVDNLELGQAKLQAQEVNQLDLIKYAIKRIDDVYNKLLSWESTSNVKNSTNH